MGTKNKQKEEVTTQIRVYKFRAKELAKEDRRQEAVNTIGGDGNPLKITNIKRAVEIKHNLQKLKGDK